MKLKRPAILKTAARSGGTPWTVVIDPQGKVVYNNFHVQSHQELTATIAGPLILHVCSNCEDRLELFAEAGFDGYHFEWQVDARSAVQRVGDRMCMVGNVNNPQVLYQGAPEDVYQQARYAVGAGVDIIGPECAIPLATALENLKAIVSTAHEGYSKWFQVWIYHEHSAQRSL
jgi:[methyl-Co(III) methanol-specific corrinoid protein]:coenzyme M methyltransferase